MIFDLLYSDYADYAVIGLYSILALTGLLGNCWVIMTVMGQLFACCNTSAAAASREGIRRRGVLPGVQSSACIYLLMLSVVDLISFVPVPLLAVDIIENHWPYNLSLCKLLFTCEGANKSLSPWVLTALSVDRYVAVCRPSFVWMRQTRFAIMALCVCVAFSMFFILPVTAHATISVIPDILGTEHRKCVVEMPRKYDALHAVFCYVIPLTLICSVYIAILRRLYVHTRKSSVGRRTSISLSRVVKCSVLVVAFYFICWTPYWAMRIMSIFASDPRLPDDLDATTPTATTIRPSINGSAATAARLYAVPPPPEDGTVVFKMNAIDLRHMMLMMYLVHALPYTQSAFNWLFYAFLNRNLRQSSRCPLGTRSGVTSTPGDGNIQTNSGTGSVAPLWKNLQHFGSYLKTTGWADASGSLLMRSFRSRSRIRSRSTTCLDSAPTSVGSRRPVSMNGHTLGVPGMTAPHTQSQSLSPFSATSMLEVAADGSGMGSRSPSIGAASCDAAMGGDVATRPLLKISSSSADELKAPSEQSSQRGSPLLIVPHSPTGFVHTATTIVTNEGDEDRRDSLDLTAAIQWL